MIKSNSGLSIKLGLALGFVGLAVIAGGAAFAPNLLMTVATGLTGAAFIVGGCLSLLFGKDKQRGY